jgi:multiple sugar transport system substrate-binding protein
MPNKISRRDFFKLAGTVAGSAVLVGCGSAATETTVATEAPAPTAVPTKGPATGNVVMMHHIQQGEMTEDMVAQFEAKYPGITIELIQTDLTRFFSMYAAGEPPDLCRVQAPSIPPYLARKMLMDLTPYFDASEVLNPDDLAPANNYYKAEDALHVGTGKLYGMVKDWSPDFTLFAYKKALADKNVPLPDTTKPLTYQEVYDLGKSLAGFDGDRITMFGFDYPDVWVDRIWMNALAETGDLLYSEDYSTINLSGSDKAKALVEYFYNHAKDKLGAVGSIIPSPNWIGDDFDKGLVATLMYGYWFSAMAETDVTKDQVLFIPAPTWTGVQRDPTMTATGMIMAAITKVPDAAWKVFEWFNGEEPAETRASSGWGVPSFKSWYSKMPNTNPYQQQVQTVLTNELNLNTPPLQFNPYIGESTVPNAFLQYLEQALTGAITFDDMLKNIETDVNSAITDGKAAIG